MSLLESNQSSSSQYLNMYSKFYFEEFLRTITLRRYSRFTLFFLHNTIDTPLILTNKRSLTSDFSRSWLQYFSNNLAKNGNNQYTHKLISQTLLLTYHRFMSELFKKQINYTITPPHPILKKYQIQVAPVLPLMKDRYDYQQIQLTDTQIKAFYDDGLGFLLKEVFPKLFHVNNVIAPSSNSRYQFNQFLYFYDSKNEELEFFYRLDWEWSHSLFFQWKQYFKQLQFKSRWIINWNYFFNIFLQQVNPIFTYNTYKVSKVIWKFSRRKVDKYFLMWKYVPLYKRGFLLLRWFIKEIQQIKGRNLENRLLIFFQNLNNDSLLTEFLKKKNFILRHVFNKYRSNVFYQFLIKK